MKPIKKFLSIGLIVSLVLLILQCESKERFYRPDLPEQICVVGLVDIDDTLSYDNICPYTLFSDLDTAASTRRIYFEKSIQPEYSDGSNDSFREFKFRISNDKEDLFVLNSNQPVSNPNIKIPTDLKFESGRKYFFHGGEKDTPGITAECKVPYLPPVPTLVSLKTGIKKVDFPKNPCYFSINYPVGMPPEDYWDYGPTYIRRDAEIEFSFTNINSDSYYAVFLIGTGKVQLYDATICLVPNFLNFELLETNTDGFFSPVKGGITIQRYCMNSSPRSYGPDCQINDTLNAYFIEGRKMPGGNCTLKILALWDNVKYIPQNMKYFRVRLMSIPKEAYLFYKSLYTFNMQDDDPFGEIVNINGNVAGGNGIIALCRSRDLIVNVNQVGGMLDPIF